MDIKLQRELARLLATLRREGRQQSGLEPRLVPPDKATAYRVAQMVAEELGWEIAGWKIAAIKEEMQRALRTDSPIYGRVFAPNDVTDRPFGDALRQAWSGGVEVLAYGTHVTRDGVQLAGPVDVDLNAALEGMP